MKWYSVKKYQPLIGSEYIVTDSEFIYAAEFGTRGWLDTSQDIELGNVTHFAIPDPIEIEE